MQNKKKNFHVGYPLSTHLSQYYQFLASLFSSLRLFLRSCIDGDKLLTELVASWKTILKTADNWQAIMASLTYIATVMHWGIQNKIFF